MQEDDDVIRRDKDVVRRLTSAQKKLAYDEERQRLSEAGPLFSTATKVVIGLYLFGCAALYFGLPQSTIKFVGSWEWRYSPEEDILSSLLSAAIELLRPLLAVVVCFWILLFLFIPYHIWSQIRDFFSWLKKICR